MKICIDLDDWMKKEWESAKKELESGIECYHNVKVSLSDREVVEGLLFYFDTEGGSDFFGEEWFEDEEIKAMIERANNSA